MVIIITDWPGIVVEIGSNFFQSIHRYNRYESNREAATGSSKPDVAAVATIPSLIDLDDDPADLNTQLSKLSKSFFG